MNYIKSYYLKTLYKACLKETLQRILKGEQGLELSRRFFNYKLHQLKK
jgi:hypothetical protein